MKKIMAALIAAVMVITLSACGQTAAPSPSAPASGSPTSAETPQPTPSDSNPKPSDSSEQETVSALDLYNEFKSDVNGVSDKYNGKSVMVTGIVVRTGPDIHGTPSVELSDTDSGKAYVLFVVNSFDQLDEVAIGETVTMSGNFHIFGSDDWVVLKQGEILSVDWQETPQSGSKVLIVYYSLTGTTEQAAKVLQEKTNGDIYLLEPETPYLADHDAVMVEMEAERESGNIRGLKGSLPDISGYDIILIGGPVWRGEPSNPIQKYLSLTDFTGKTVAGFWTAGANPANYADRFKEQVKGGEVIEGLSLIGTRDLDTKTDAWLEQLGLNAN